ncbi:RNA-directed DNA polymerase from mobile element jockey [Caerostris extrusa]|uniref:RNA-directed DNA polymerase from mobile element jockey n=1 Tax=Caerostris extrusa TaxID=172846 RepID=A0AAV4RAR9_CAEEX|nr:RNA-directed DNA polymerase from mobile element jockey [Caerostris extrusa]
MFSTANRRNLQNLHSLRIGCWNACGLRRQFDEAYFRGTCIFFKKALVHYQIPTPELESTEATIINIGNKNQISFISIYCKTHHRFNTNDINKLLNVNRYVIIAGDFNATHAAWNNVKDNQKGIQLNKFLNTKQNLKIIAPNSPTRFSPSTPHTVNILDFAIFQNIPYNANTNVLTELNSDHLPIIIDVEMSKPPHTAPHNFNTNWHDYNYHLQSTDLNSFTIDSKESADKAIKNFTNAMHTA